MKIIFRITLLIAMMAGLISGYYWLMQRFEKTPLLAEELEQIKLQVAESKQGYLDLTGKLVRQDFYFFVEQPTGQRVPVHSQNLELSSYVDKQVTVRVGLVNDKLEIIKIEELSQKQ